MIDISKEQFALMNRLRKNDVQVISLSDKQLPVADYLVGRGYAKRARVDGVPYKDRLPYNVLQITEAGKVQRDNYSLSYLKLRFSIGFSFAALIISIISIYLQYR